MISITLKIFLFILCLILSAYFSSSEVALMSITKAKVKTFLKRGDKRAIALATLKKNTDHTLITILTGNNIVNVAAASIATSIAIDQFGDAGVGIATGVVVFLLLVFGEIGPKIFGVRVTDTLALQVAPSLYILSRIFSPFLWVYDHVSHSSSLTRAFAKPAITEEEIKGWIDLGKEEGTIEPDEHDMLYSVFEFGDTLARDVMTPRPDVALIKDTSTVNDVIKIFKDTGFSRIPVFHDQVDNIVGILNMKDILSIIFENKTGVEVRDIMSEPLFVPESKKIDDLLKELRHNKVHLAIVIDEYGGFAGVVTVEDILEELVGEIQDEYDREEPTLQEIEPGTYLVNGRTKVEDLNEELSLRLPVHDAYETISGLIIERLGHIPQKGEEVDIIEGNVTLVVIQMKKSRILTLKMIVHEKRGRQENSPPTIV